MANQTTMLHLLDMHRTDIGLVPIDEARDLVATGRGRYYHSHGRVSQIQGVVLTISLSALHGILTPERALSISNFCGTRFIFKAKISTEAANFYAYRHKKMDPHESPDAALIRMMGPQLRKCPPPTRAARVTSRTSGGLKRSPVRSADGRDPSTLPSRQPTLALAA